MHFGKLEEGIKRLGEIRGKVSVGGNMFNEAKSDSVRKSADAMGLFDHG